MKPELRRSVPLMLGILVIASLVNSFYVPLAGRRVRLEHFAGPAVFVAFAVSQLLRRKPAVRLDGFSALAAAWVVANGISSWLYAPHAAESFVHVTRLGLLAAIFLTVANLPPFGADGWRGRFRLWLALGILELGYGLVIWLLARYSGIWLPGASVEAGLLGIAIMGTQFERNLFGILAATLLVAAFYLLLAQRHRGRDRLAPTSWLVVACALSGGAVVLSLTRSAWLALVVASPVAYVLFDRRPPARADRPLLLTGVGLPVVLVAFLAILRIVPAPGTVQAEGSAAALDIVSASQASAAAAPTAAVVDRLSTLSHLRSDFTLSTRIQDARWAVNDWLASPLLGRGTGSFVQIHGTRVGTEAWVSNLVLHTLLDTGLVGLAIQMLLFLLVARRAWQAAEATTEPQLEVGLKALTLGFVVIAIAYQVTDGTWLAVFWIHLGLMVNGIYCVRTEPPGWSQEDSVWFPDAPVVSGKMSSGSA